MNVEKKLREAKFFLDKMIEQEAKDFNHKEPFEFYFSAFLNAGRSVGYRLQHVLEAAYGKDQGKARYLRWRKAWEKATLQAQQNLIKFMINTRDVEVHEGGSSPPVEKTENRELGPGVHSFASATHTVAGPPGVFPLAIVPGPVWCFTIDGTERNATEACGEYLALLERMVADFKAQPR
jgi:hypothetical protein